EVSAEGTVGATQESEVVAAKGNSKPRPQRRRKKDVISPTVGENLVDEDEEMEEETQAVDLQVRKRRRLRKSTSIPVAEVDSEETQSDENVPKLASNSDVNKEG
ncbi:hypothetical protein Dimus_001122, partial [Dionaea muscipula]